MDEMDKNIIISYIIIGIGERKENTDVSLEQFLGENSVVELSCIGCLMTHIWVLNLAPPRCMTLGKLYTFLSSFHRI